MQSPSVSRRAKAPLNYQSLCEYNLDLLLSGLLTSKKADQVVTTTGPQFSATVTAFDNSFLAVAAKVQLAGAVDAVGDRAGICRIIGLNAAGAYAYEDLALNAGDSSTLVESVNTYSKVFVLQNRHSAAWTIAQNITCKATGTANVVCTLPAGTTRYGKVSSALTIPAPYGTFAGAGGGAFVTDKGWFKSVTAVYNITDDAGRTTNLLAGAGFDQASDLTGLMDVITDGFEPGVQRVYLTTGLGSAKTYEVQGTYQPYQGVLDGSETLEILYISPDIHTSSSGTGAPTVANTVPAAYVPVSVKLPFTNGFNDTALTRENCTFTNLATTSGGHGGYVRIAAMYWGTATLARFNAGASVTFGSASSRRGRQTMLVGGVQTTVAGPDVAGSTNRVNFLPMLAKVTNVGTNTSVAVGEVLLLLSGHAQQWTRTDCRSAADAFKLDPTVIS